MDLKTLQSVLTIGEAVAVEFKRCGNGMESDTYETVCSFLNRFGGDIFMGVLDDGTVLGVPEKAAPDMVKNFIKVVSNPALFSPTVYLMPEIIKYDKTHTIIHVQTWKTCVWIYSLKFGLWHKITPVVGIRGHL